MHCIAHRSYGVCTALPIGAMGYALHCPQELWGMHCIAHILYNGLTVVFELIIKSNTLISRSIEERSGARTQWNVLRKA